MQPIRRDLDFDLTGHFKPAEICHWHPQGRHVTHFFNALSIFFPEGERFFIHAVRHYRDRITDPQLQQAVSGFIGQEAMHGREHVEYNELLAKAGLPAGELDARVGKVLARLKRRLWPSAQLSVTLALEHFTSMLAHITLTRPAVLAGADPRLAALWRWHALEETEHKAVAYDVYQVALDRGPRAYLERCIGLVATTAVFMSLLFSFHLRLIRSDPQARGLRGWGRLVNFLFGRPGVLRLLVLPWLDYFRPGFHPWNHDNRRLLAQVDEISAIYASPPQNATPVAA